MREIKTKIWRQFNHRTRFIAGNERMQETDALFSHKKVNSVKLFG